MDQTLEGQAAIVTGAGRGIGKAVALALAAAGAKVVLAARSVDQIEAVKAEIEKVGGAALAVRTDVTDPAEVAHLVAVALERFGSVDLLVNNAGSNDGGPNGSVGPLWEVNPGAWWWDIEVNLKGTFLCSREALGPMVAAGRGRIVNIVSMAAVMPWPFDSAYACSKAAVIRLTDSLAEELRDTGVKVFSLSPGSVDTDLRAGAVDSPAGKKWLTKVNPNPDWVPAERPAASVVALAGGEADGLTGRFMSVDWDLGSLAGRSDEIVEGDRLQMRLVGP